MVAGVRTSGRLVAAAILAIAALPVIGATAGSQPCPDIGVVFARGTSEPPGVGGVGQRFVDALQTQAFPRTVGVHGVIYPASNNFTDGTVFKSNVIEGVRDEANHVRGVTLACPSTRMILGGYSQGAVVTALATGADGCAARGRSLADAGRYRRQRCRGGPVRDACGMVR